MTSVTMLLRSGLSAVGALAIVWSCSTLPYFDGESRLTVVANMARRGETFSPAMLAAAKAELLTDSPRMRGSMLPYAEMVSLLLLERSPATGDTGPAGLSVAEFERTTRENLARNPTDGLAWLALFWLRTFDEKAPSDEAYRYLRMSYLAAPNEGWIAEKRAPLVLRYFPVLPADVAEAAVSEFAHLVRSYLYVKAAEILEGAPPAAQDALRARLQELPEAQRKVFAAAWRERSPEASRERARPVERPWH